MSYSLPFVVLRSTDFFTRFFISFNTRGSAGVRLAQQQQHVPSLVTNLFSTVVQRSPPPSSAILFIWFFPASARAALNGGRVGYAMAMKVVTPVWGPAYIVSGLCKPLSRWVLLLHDRMGKRDEMRGGIVSSTAPLFFGRSTPDTKPKRQTGLWDEDETDADTVSQSGRSLYRLQVGETKHTRASRLTCTHQF